MIIWSSYNGMPLPPMSMQTIQISDKSSEAWVFPIMVIINLFKLKRQLQLAHVIWFVMVLMFVLL